MDAIAIAADAAARARALGATDSEATVSEGSEFSAEIRLGQVEQVKEAGSSAIGIRVLVGTNTGSSYTSDFSAEGIDAMVARAMELARITTPDPYAGLPDPIDLGSVAGDLAIYSEATAAMEAPLKIELARRAERAALDTDPRINNSEGATFTSRLSLTAFVNSRGFEGSYRSSSCSLSCSPVAADNGRMERDYWFSLGRGPAQLDSPEEVGRKAAGRVLRRLNPRKVPTQKAAVVFEPRVARSIAGHLFELVSGDAIYRGSSMFAGKLGQTVASAKLTLVDDGTLPGLFGTTPFDDEGVPSRRTTVISAGVLNSFLLNSYAARKLGLRTTGSASRGITGNASVGHGNLFIAPGEASAADLLRAAGTGLYVTELMGFGFNPVTGDYSRGATGLWIENGELAYPVSEVTIAANFADMLMAVTPGSDLEFLGSVAAPALLFPEVTISGT
ncbi:MAG: TldD/PmbA family protein [Acidobacteria bacterium]|nr:TldD/PmbA family protein [Acidobacteriota bacterium]